MANNDVVSQKGALIGDENQPEPREPEFNRVEKEVDAQVSPPREADSGKVSVDETSVQLDRVITDPSSPEAVQVPDAGRGSTDLPAHRLAQGVPSFEDEKPKPKKS